MFLKVLGTHIQGIYNELQKITLLAKYFLDDLVLFKIGLNKREAKNA